MGWIFIPISRAELIHRLIAPEINDVACFDTIAHALQDDVLWTVERVAARQRMRHLEPGQSLCRIACFLLKENEGMWGFQATDESAYPPYYSCPPHFLDMARETCPAWREKVRDYHHHRLPANAAFSSLAA